MNCLSMLFVQYMLRGLPTFPTARKCEYLSTEVMSVDNGRSALGWGQGLRLRSQQLWKHCMFFNSPKTMEDSDSRSSSDKEEEISVIL